MDDEKSVWVIVPEGHYDSIYTPVPTAVYTSEDEAHRAIKVLEEGLTRMVEEYGEYSTTRTGYTAYNIPLDSDPEDLLG